MWAAIPVIGPIIEKIVETIEKAVPDKDLQHKLAQELQMTLAQLDYSAIQEEVKAQAQVLAAEITGQSWLQRNWRPLLMLMIMGIVANNYIVFPYASMFTDKVQVLDLPDPLWNLMILGTGGYIFGRSGEKIIQTIWKKGGK